MYGGTYSSLDGCVTALGQYSDTLSRISSCNTLLSGAVNLDKISAKIKKKKKKDENKIKKSKI